jgi:SAM-dependent methyltransferase
MRWYPTHITELLKATKDGSETSHRSTASPRCFDRIFSVHCIYFWRDVDAALAKLANALKPGGKLVLTFRPESEDIPARFRDPTYWFTRFGGQVLDESPTFSRLTVLRLPGATPKFLASLLCSAPAV